MSELKDRSVIEAALESGEVVFDAAMKGDVIADIPVIGTAFKLCRAADTIRDRAFSAKLACFISGLDGVSEKTKEEIKEKISSSPEEGRKVGETLFMVLERFTDLDKPVLLAKLFLCYIESVISSAELRRFSQAIDAAFGDDLIEYLESGSPSERCMESLIPSGLTKAEAGITIEDIGTTDCVSTPMGERLRFAYQHIKSKP